jgi:hypothetical protein
MRFNVTTTLIKTNQQGTTSVWQFGRLSNGWYGGKSLTGEQRFYFKTPVAMQKCITTYTEKYGYTSPVTSDVQA